MEKPNVFIVSASQLSRGGIESHLFSLFSTLADQVDFTLMAACSPELASKLATFNVRHVPWQVNGYLDYKSAAFARKHIRRHNPDLVHIHDPRAGFLLRPILFFMQIPVIYTVHLPPYYFYASKGLTSTLRTFLYRVIETLLNWLFTTKIVYVSKYVFQEALLKRIAPKSRAVFIPTGINVHKFRQAAQENAHNILTHSPKRIIINVSRHHPEKNVAMVLHAAAQLLHYSDNLEFWLVGDGPQSDELIKIAQELHLQNNLRFLGARDDIPQLLSKSDIFLLTSHYEGGRSIAIQEAQSAGKPVVVSNVGDNSKLVDHQINGWVFEEGNLNDCLNGLEQLLESPQQIVLWGMAAKDKAAAEYDEKTNNQGFLNLYHSLRSLHH